MNPQKPSKVAQFRCGRMENITMGVLALYALLGIALLTLWLRHQAVLRQRERMREKMGALQGDLSYTSQRLPQVGCCIGPTHVSLGRAPVFCVGPKGSQGCL